MTSEPAPPTSAYTLIARAPSLAEYEAVVTAVGWHPFLNLAAVEESLAHSLHCAVIEYQGHVVAMGRLVGDGAMYAYIQDLAVMPAHQRRGLGRRLMDHLLDTARELASGSIFVGLFATTEAHHLYESVGFRVPSELVGMARQVVGERREPLPPSR